MTKWTPSSTRRKERDFAAILQRAVPLESRLEVLVGEEKLDDLHPKAAKNESSPMRCQFSRKTEIKRDQRESVCVPTFDFWAGRILPFLKNMHVAALSPTCMGPGRCSPASMPLYTCCLSSSAWFIRLSIRAIILSSFLLNFLSALPVVVASLGTLLDPDPSPAAHRAWRREYCHIPTRP